MAFNSMQLANRTNWYYWFFCTCPTWQTRFHSMRNQNAWKWLNGRHSHFLSISNGKQSKTKPECVRDNGTCAIWMLCKLSEKASMTIIDDPSNTHAGWKLAKNSQNANNNLSIHALLQPHTQHSNDISHRHHTEQKKDVTDKLSTSQRECVR